MYIFKHIAQQHITGYNQETHGWELIIEANSIEDFKSYLEKREALNWFDQEDGVVTDQNGDLVYDPKYPTIAEFGDYDYHFEQGDLNDYQVKAVKLAKEQGWL